MIDVVFSSVLRESSLATSAWRSSCGRFDRRPHSGRDVSGQTSPLRTAEQARASYFFDLKLQRANGGCLGAKNR